MFQNSKQEHSFLIPRQFRKHFNFFAMISYLLLVLGITCVLLNLFTIPSKVYLINFESCAKVSILSPGFLVILNAECQ